MTAKNLRISLVTETYFPQINGVSRTLDRLVQHCSEQGDRLQLLIPSYKSDAAAVVPRVETCEWWAIPLPFYKEIVIPMVTVKAVTRALADFRPDLVHIATEGLLGWAALRAARRLGIPVVSSYHTHFAQYLENYHAGFLSPLCWQYLRWFHNATLATFCPTETARNLLEGKGFTNVDIWSRGVDSHRFHPGKRDHRLREELGVAHDETLLVYAGRIANEKNLEMLMTAWQALPHKDKCHLLFIGDGPLRMRLEGRQQPRTLFVGYRYGEELARLYASCDLFVFPSLSETFGNVILEAMASGLPVIGFNVQGPKDIIQNHITGQLVEKIKAESLAAAIEEVLSDPPRMYQMGQSARAYAETCSWQQIMGKLHARYCELVSISQDSSRQPIRTHRYASGARKGAQGKSLPETH